jgi:hypothetical protein
MSTGPARAQKGTDERKKEAIGQAGKDNFGASVFALGAGKGRPCSWENLGNEFLCYLRCYRLLERGETEAGRNPVPPV